MESAIVTGTAGGVFIGSVVTRRSVAAGLVTLGLAGAARASTPSEVVEKPVLVPTIDGSAEAALFYPAGGGVWPAILFWPEGVGVRAIDRGRARRLAAQGFVVLVPDTFYRSVHPEDIGTDPDSPAARAALLRYRVETSDDGIARDTIAYVAFLDAQKQTDRIRKAATIGYDLGASYAFRAAAASPERIAAVGSIYGVSVAAARPNSPHLLVPRTEATYYVAIARDHDRREPDDKRDIVAVIDAAKLHGTVEVYPADRGWADRTSRTYDAAAADRAFAALVALCRSALR